jgi:hypothetical protein
MKCLECLDDFSTERGLHLHVSKKHKISLQDYYHKFFPRFDLFSNEKIEFKNLIEDSIEQLNRDLETLSFKLKTINDEN